MAYRSIPLSRKKIRKFASELRAVLGLEKEYYFPIVHLLEIFQAKGELELEILPKEEMGDNEALTYPKQNLIKIREDVYEAATIGKGRARFTLAHEFGHFLLHQGSNILFARNILSIKTYEDPEWQADCFAGEILMGENLCKGLEPFEIARKCGVSYRAAEVQKSTYKNKKVHRQMDLQKNNFNGR